MNPPSTQLPSVELIATRIRPFRVQDLTADVYRGMEEQIQQSGFADQFRVLELRDENDMILISSDFTWLSLDEVTQLAEGNELRTPLGEIEAAGRLRMMRGLEDGKLVMLILEFLPDEPVAQGTPLNAWHRLRFPESSCRLCESSHEPWWIHFYRLWMAETQPSPTLAPDDPVLCRAVLNNHEHWVEAILANQPRVEVIPGREKSITQTALGIAMENTGMYGDGPGFMSGCHRRFRDDDFTLAEDPDTWVPRAQRIAERLKAAGAIDYSFLLVVCRLGEVDEVEAYLKAGFPPNFSIYGHTTALCEAIQPGHEEVCDLLLCYGADPNLPRPFDTSMTFGGEIYPLSLAIEHPAILKRLLQAGANPNLHRDDLEKTPVLMANKFESRDHAAEIFSMVDFASIRGIHGRNGLFYLNSENLNHCRECIPTTLLDEPDARGTTPLLHAISFEDVDKVERLIEMGADPTKPGMIWQDDYNALLFRKVDTGPQTTHWLTPVQVALLIGNPDMVEYLINLGAIPKRHSLQVHVPSIQTQDDFRSLHQQLREDLAPLEGGMIRAPLKIDPYFPNDRARACEELLAAMMMQNPALTAIQYPEFIQSIDLAAWAEGQNLHPALIEPFRSGHMLDKLGWFQCLQDVIGDLNESIRVFAEAMHAPPSDEEMADTYELIGSLRYAEQTLMDATLRITGKRIKPLFLTHKAREFASSEFNGGTARACRDAETKGEVGVDDFVEALSENLNPGSTLDHGKLLQAVQKAALRLEQCCNSLRKKTN